MTNGVLSMKEMADEYVRALQTPPNAWGAHYSKKYGVPTDSLLIRMIEEHGRKDTYEAVDEAWKRWENKATG